MSEDIVLTLWEHFEELSLRVRRIVILLIIVMVAVMSIPSDISTILRLDFSEYQPLVSSLIETIQITLLPEGVTLIALNWLDSFYIYILFSFVISFVICLPYIAIQLYGFIAPAMYEEERNNLFKFVFLFILLFVLGAIYSYYVIIPTTFNVLYRFVNQARVMPFYSVKDFFDLILFGLFGTGLFSTFPILIYMLVVIDLIRVEDLKNIRRELIVSLSILTAILTPDPTPVSMLLMTIPFFLLYELTIQILSRTIREKPDRIVENGIEKAKQLLEKNKATKPP
jgi:sec-independent protein translocase protein TatC